MPYKDCWDLTIWDNAASAATAIGRRKRVFLRLVSVPMLAGVNAKETTYGDLYEALTSHDGSKWPHLPAMREQMTKLPLRQGGTVPTQIFESIPEDYNLIRTSGQVDPAVHYALTDLVYNIRYDLHEACGALDDPDIYYPGVDSGIEPVSDDKIDLVIWATQRELDRELRGPLRGNIMETGYLPAVPLIELPQRIKRAFVERRRLRYAQWGIGQKEWEENAWSLWNVPEDPDWVPYWEPEPSQTQIAQEDVLQGEAYSPYGYFINF